MLEPDLPSHPFAQMRTKRAWLDVKLEEWSLRLYWARGPKLWEIWPKGATVARNNTAARILSGSFDECVKWAEARAFSELEAGLASIVNKEFKK